MEEEKKTKPTELTKEELWQMRALIAKQEGTLAKIMLLQKEKAEVEKDIQEFQAIMADKYGSDAQALADGTLRYPPSPVMPLVKPPVEQPSEEAE